MLAAPAVASAAPATTTASQQSLTVKSGQTATIEKTTRLHELTIAKGGSLVAPSGKVLSLTVDGVETGSKLESTKGTATVLEPGRYRGNLVLTVTDDNTVAYSGLTYHLRQALFVDSDGVVDSSSVRSAILGGRVTDSSASGTTIRSTGEAFDGVYLDGADYTLRGTTFRLKGNGRSDFVGEGAAITATNGSRLVVDDADVQNKGVVRTGVIADGGNTVVVKNSTIATSGGTLPSDYKATVDLAQMRQAPWMLGLEGTVRATNLLGDDTTAAYIGSSISSSGWGVLSTDTGSNGHLSAIDSSVSTGTEGYGSYAIGGATEEFLGTKFDVDTYAAINRGGAIHYGDSTKSAVAALNTSDDLGLSAKELKALKTRATTIDSDQWGVMWHGAGSVDIDGGTQVRTGLSTFLDKGQQVDIDVDGSDGAKLTPGNGVLVQVMEDDDPGPGFDSDGDFVNNGTYTEPTTAPTKNSSFDTTAVHSTDARSTFTDIALKGNLYNGMRGESGNPMKVQGKNLVLNLDGSTLTGVVSASTTKHAVSTITEANYEQLGKVSNKAGAVVNNGVIVDLTGHSRWTVTGTSYLSSLTVQKGSAITAPHGKKVVLTVDGKTTPLQAGTTYTGALTLSVG